MFRFAKPAREQTETYLATRDIWKPSSVVIHAPFAGDVGTLVGTMGTQRTRMGSGGVTGAESPRFLRFSARRWLPFLDTYRTMYLSPDRECRRLLTDIREMRLAA